MNNIDNIISHIKNSADATVEKILKDAESEVKNIKDEAENKLKQEVDALNKKCEQELKNIGERSITSSEIKKQKLKLSAKNEVILDTIEKAKEKILALDDKAYVDMLKKLFSKNIPDKDCVIKFNEKDLKRLPKDFFDELVSSAKGCKVSIAKEPINIDGGFVIDFGDIIWNLSINSLIDQNIEAITDKVNKLLFG